MLRSSCYELARRHALLNAVRHRGKACCTAVLGKVLAERPELKPKLRELKKIIEAVVWEINNLSLEEQRTQLQTLGVGLEKVERPYSLPPLSGAEDGKVVTAFPPEPSKHPHLGHAKAALLNYLYAKRYAGKFWLRFEDTNPRLCKQEYYEAMLEGLQWLEIEPDQINYASDHMKEFYEKVEQLIAQADAYVCTCGNELIKLNRKLMQECECRRRSVEQNLELWRQMPRMPEGSAVVRLRLSMRHSNAAMRDPTLLRIVDASHPRTGERFRLWPTYDFATAVLDSLEGVTHRLRSKEFELRDELQRSIQSKLGLSSPYIEVFGRLSLEDTPTSGRKIRELLREGKLRGWDDPRLVTLAALRRRGFLPEALRDFLVRTGVSKAEAKLDWKMLEAVNRQHLDAKANRYFGLFDPVRISLVGVELKSVKVPMHPSFPERGEREVEVDTGQIYVERLDFERLRSKEVVLMYLCTVLLGEESRFLSWGADPSLPKIHWLSKSVEAKVIMPDGSERRAWVEPAIEQLEVGVQFQLMRVGFFKLDGLKPLTLYFTHS